MATHTERRRRIGGSRRGTRTRRRLWRTVRTRRGGRLGGLIWLLALAVALLLAVGIALTWARADAGVQPVHAIMQAGTWLASPFHDVFTDPDARVRLTENWLLATCAYLVGGRILAWALGR